MHVVVDTNVLVSGLLSSRGAPAKIVDALLEGWLAPRVSGDQDIHAVEGAQFRAMTPARFAAEFIADKAR